MSELTRVLAAQAATNASTIHSLVSQQKWTEALTAINRQADLHADLAAEVVLEAARKGMTQKRIADLLGVPAATLRGLKQEAGIA
jgi:DNA-directed RNA polymerase specialized sigma24 family protein